MSDALHHFHFLQPWWLLGFLALPLILMFASRGNASQRELSRLADAELLPHLLSGETRGRRWSSGLFALGWMLCLLALAGPTWSRIADPLYANRTAQVVAVSLSQHMLARDVLPRRIDRARYKAHDLFAANRDGLNALIGYAGQSFVVAPLTSDAHSLDDLLDAMAPDIMPVDGDNAAQAIEQGVQLIRDAKVSNGSLVLITDDADAAAQAAARKALTSGVRVSVLGIGTEQGAPVPQVDGSFLRDEQSNMVVARRNDANLRALAQAGGGRYVAMSEDGNDIAALHLERPSSSSTSVAEGQSGDAWQDEGPWLLLPLLLVAAMVFRRGWILLVPLALLPLWPHAVYASDWQDWWQRPDQQAASALRQGNAAKAQLLANDPAWRGAAAYRANDYAAAVKALEQAKGADAQYNLGNALAKLGHYPEAIKAYDHALREDPRNEDARVNRKMVEDAMRKSPQGSSSSQQQPSGGGQGNQDKQSGQNGDSGQSSAQKQDGQNQGQQSGQSGQQQDNDKSGSQSSNSGNDSQGAQSQNKQQGSESQQNARSNSAQPASNQTPAPASTSEQAQAAKAQQGLQAQLNQALSKEQQKGNQLSQGHDLGTVESDDPLAKLPNDVRRDLQRVPDDPGALLRRKFELEYRERMGAQPVDGDGP